MRVVQQAILGQLVKELLAKPAEQVLLVIQAQLASLVVQQTLVQLVLLVAKVFKVPQDQPDHKV